LTVLVEADSGQDATVFERARQLYRFGRVADARRLLEHAVGSRPQDLALRYALGVCLNDLSDWKAAEEHLIVVSQAEPGHYLAAYQLGIALQGQRRLAEAATAYRQALAQHNVEDAWGRLRQCEATQTSEPTELAAPDDPTLAVAVNHVVPAPVGAGTLAHDIDERSVVDAGARVVSTRTALRHLSMPAIAASGFGALVLVTGLGQSNTGFGVLTSWVGVGMLIFAALAWGIVVLQSRLSLFDFYKRRMDLSQGILDRSKVSIWYANVVQISYVRNFGSYLTNTASLQIDYVVGTEHKTLTLPGLGTPKDVDSLRQDLQPLIARERRVMKKNFF
jgi:Tetratricopeptide repeat